ncbi:hypothetical protein HNP37_001602 [Flavobacterium nitrogenifigens]|uniref:Uncharacterized protein n=2 Tax=Flavobacterium TaxID=237 RepID=A0A7W7N7M1_9FLAO|nr:MULTISPECIES: hypothetical protein [Flavobacterium]MBB4801541.1 hypothetical protein [Flavobacterium nitrogenifigens]MBB6386498.1 hypothetical protein [Flavobacterium notoginsengisoli]
MRKLIVFLVFMNMLLFGGGQYLNANTFGPHKNHHVQKHRVKFTNQDRGSSTIEDATDIDLEEDLLGNDDTNVLTNKFFAASYSLVDTLYLALSDQSAANDFNRFKNSTPVLGHSNPLYITQQVLRI